MSLTSTTPDWPIKPLSTVIVEMRGGAPLKPNDFTKDGVKVLPKGAVGRTGWLDVTEKDLQYCSHDYANAHRTNQIDEQYTVVVLRDLVPSGPSIGLIVRIRDAERWLLAQGVYGFRLNDELDPAYLSQLSNTQWYRKLMNQIMVGSTQVHITNTAFKAASVPMPPLAEQRVIATALSDVDALIAGLERLIAKKRDIKLAAMQQLLTGQTRLPGFSGEWSSVEIGEVAVIRNVKIAAASAPRGTMCVELESICQGTGQLLWSFEAAGATPKYTFKSGDVLFGRLRAYLRKYWRATFDGICSTEIWPLIPRDSRLTSAYLYWVVQTEEFIDAAAISYGTHMPRSDWLVLKRLSFQLPPSEEQTAIATFLSDMDADLAALEARLTKTRAIKQGMMQELLTGRTRLV